MGTNYYLSPNCCIHCGRGDEKKHIGKSSGGWTFSLHVYPEDGIKDLLDWIPFFEAKGSKILDEYDREISGDMMLGIIRDREGKERDWDKSPSGYSSWEEFHRRNYSEKGPNGLLRFKVADHHCIGHGEGPWDLITGEFS
jgi:hypothetical protein